VNCSAIVRIKHAAFSAWVVVLTDGAREFSRHCDLGASTEKARDALVLSIPTREAAPKIAHVVER